MTVSETAARLRVSKMTVYRMVHSGELPAVRIGRGFRIHRQHLAEFLRAAHDAVAPAHPAAGDVADDLTAPGRPSAPFR